MTASTGKLNGREVCIVMLSALGDAVHVLPIVCAIKRDSPGCRITWVTGPAAARLVSGHPRVDEIIVHGKGFAALTKLKRDLRGRKFDVLIDLQVALKAGLTTMVIPATRKIGFDIARARDFNWVFTTERIPARANQHVQDQYFEFLAHLGVAAEPVEWLLDEWPGEEKIADHLVGASQERRVALAIATSWKEKDWVPQRWAELADALYSEMGLQPVLVGGLSEKEKAIAQTISAQAKAPVRSTLGCSLRELVGVLKSCALVISPDTAPLHMSVALNVPAIALMGYTNPKRVGPYRRFRNLIVDAYGNPGEDYAPSLEYREGRMETITVAHVMEKVRKWARSSG